MKFVFFGFGENGLSDEGADGGNASPHNFWAETASFSELLLRMEVSASTLGHRSVV